MIKFLFGFCIGSFIFEPLIINFVYLSNIDLFIDIILTKTNRNKLIRYFKNRKEL